MFMAPTSSADVFISYARADLRSGNARRRSLPLVVEALKARGLRVFLDTSEIDGFVSLSQTITAAIEQSKYVLAWYSPTYPTRPACRAELSLACVAARAADRPVILAINTEDGTSHIVHSEILGQNMLPSPSEDDPAAAAALAARIAEIVQADARPIGSIATTPPRWYPSQVSGSSRFVGRLREIWELDATLWPLRGSLDSGVLHEPRGLATCLTGLTGSGKTVLALEYARLLAPAYPGGVFWLSAAGRDDAPAQQLEVRLDAALRAIASALGIATQRSSTEHVRQDIAARLEADARSCLWIVDDLPPGLDQPSVERWLGPARSRTIITTQSTEYDFLPNLRLGAMDTAEAMALLTSDNAPTGDDERRAAEEIVRGLDGHPMGLDMARAYLLHRRSYSEFAERLKTDAGTDILERAGELSRRPSMQVVMLSTFSLLNDDGLAALRAASAVPALPVPESLIRSVAGRSADSSNDVELGISALLDLSLARRIEPGVIQLHSLVNRAARYLEPERVGQLRPFVASALFYQLDGVTLLQLSSVRHEVRLARESYGEPKTPPDLWAHRAALRAETLAGAFQSSLPAWQTQRRATDAIMGAASWEAILARCGLSEVLRELGRSEEALSVAEEALYWSERSHGWTDGHTVVAAEVVALALASAGRRDDALRMFQRVRDAYGALGAAGAAGLARTRANLSVLGEGEGLTAMLNESMRNADADPEALRTVVQLAPLETRAGRPAVAVRLLSPCLTRLLDIAGNDNPLTCECKTSLAAAHAALEQYAQADELLRGALAWYEKELGAGHATTVATRHQLMTVRARMGDRQVLHAMEAASAANQESARLFAAGERAAALVKAEEALSRTRDLFGAESPETITHLHNVAQIAGAVDLERTVTALDDLFRLLASDDPRRKEEVALLALAADSAAAAARSRGDSSAACRWCERLLQAQDELTGPRSDATLMAAWNLSMLLDEDGRRDEGMAIFVDRVSYLLAVEDATLSPDLRAIREAAGAKTRDSRTREGARLNQPRLDDERLAGAAERANAMIDAGTPWEALDEMRQLADEFARRYGSCHPKTLWVNFMLWTSVGRSAEMNRNLDTLSLAIEQLRMVGRAQRAQLGEDHAAVLSTFQNLAGLLRVVDPAEAARLDEQSLETSRRVHGAEDPTTVMIALNAVESAAAISNFTGARSILSGYLGWLVEQDAAALPAELRQAQAQATEIGRRLGIFVSL
jgi:tetratricopeptide (TPR) repeat protein